MMMNTARTIPLAALLLGACAGAPAPQTFDEWVAGLPQSEGFTPYHAEMAMTMRFDMDEMIGRMEGVDQEVEGEPAQMVMEATVRGTLDYAARDRAHAEMEMLMDFTGFGDAGMPSALDMAMVMVVDGESLWIEPDWRSNWIVDAMESGGGSFADMVFRAKLQTLVRVGESYGEAMQQMAPEMFGEGDYMEMMGASLDLAAWPRMMERWFAVVESFEVVDDEAHVTLVLSDEYAEMMAAMGATPMFSAEDFADLRYYMTADLQTGVPRTFSFAMEGPFAMQAEMSFEPRDAASWPEGYFKYALPDGRNAFPIDVYLDLAASMMQQAYPPVEQDLEF